MQDLATIKTCTKCGEEYPATPEYFYKEKMGVGGLRAECKKCKATVAKKYRQTSIGREVLEKAQRKFWQSPAGKLASREYHKKYHSTIAGHLYQVFSNIKQRCNNPNNKSYIDYGGRGIKNNFKSLDDFRNYIINELLIDPRGLEIDRIDNNGHYEKGNIRFVTRSENCYNRKR